MNLEKLPNHHAILLTHSNRKSLANKLWNELADDSRSHRFFDQTVLDIDTARQIISWAKSAYEGERVGLISFHTIGLPAQNALLKILEEPNAKTRFVLITSNKSNLIETVISRLHHHKVDNEGEVTNNSADLFLTTLPTERMKLKLITNLLAQVDEEDRKDREAVKAFILSLAGPLTVHVSYSRYVEEVLAVASYASDPSSSGKALLEYLSLLLPQTKV